MTREEAVAARHAAAEIRNLRAECSLHRARLDALARVLIPGASCAPTPAVSHAGEVVDDLLRAAERAAPGRTWPCSSLGARAGSWPAQRR